MRQTLSRTLLRKIYISRAINRDCSRKLDNTVITIDDAAKQVLIADTSTNYQSKLFSKKWIIKGDSISDIQYLTGIKKYYEYISEDTGIIVDAYGGAGSGYAREKTNKDSTKVTNGIFHEGIEELPDKCDIFTLFGGTNDWKCDNVNYPLGNIGDTGLTTITGFIKQCFENVRSKYANGDTLITVFTPLPRAECYPLIDKSGEVTTKPHGYTLGELSYRIMELSELYNFKCLDLYHLARCYCYNDVFRQKYMYDTVHYNSKGNELFAKDIKGFLESLF